VRNRAKCKLCNSELESFAKEDYIECKCGEIAIVGGMDYLGTFARNYTNFLRIDEKNREIGVKYEEKQDKQDGAIDKEEQLHKPTKNELITMLDEMIKAYENLPKHAMLAPVSHADQLSLLMVVSSLFKSI
jgi:hypothetical protein